jgi:hypothetical protein
VDEEDRRPGGGAAPGDVEGDAVDVRGPVPHLVGSFGRHRHAAALLESLISHCAYKPEIQKIQAPSTSHAFWGETKLLLFLYANQQLAYWQSPILADWHTDLSLGFNNFSSEKQKSG